MKSWIVYGPPGCGKTRNALRIREHLNAAHGAQIKYTKDGLPCPSSQQLGREHHTLFLTNEEPRFAGRRVVTYEQVAKEAGFA